MTKETLASIELRLEEAEQGWITVGWCLDKIKVRRMYRPQYESFDEYLKHRWDYSARHAHRFITASHQVLRLRRVGIKDNPTSVGQAMQLHRIPTDEELKEIWLIAMKAPTRAERSKALRSELRKRGYASEAYHGANPKLQEKRRKTVVPQEEPAAMVPIPTLHEVSGNEYRDRLVSVALQHIEGYLKAGRYNDAIAAINSVRERAEGFADAS